MSNRILVPYDGSEQSEDALAYALAAFPDDNVVLLHVIEPTLQAGDPAIYTDSQYNQRREAAGEMLDDAAADHPDRIETEIAFGRPVHEILGETEDNHIDHIVMGSHGRDGAARLLLGSVAETVVRRAPVPVTVVRHHQEQIEQPERVLVPFDGSTQAREALEYALDRFETAAVTAVYVLYPASYTATGTPAYRDTVDELNDWEDYRDSHASEVLETTQTIASEHGRDVQTDVLEGKPAETIVEYADTEAFDHVVIGSTGRDGIARLLLGSVAETVVRRSPVSVTVTK